MSITSISLVVFTVLVQAAAGLVLSSELARYGKNEQELKMLRFCLPLALAIGVFGLLFSSTHLASPLAAYNVLNNIFVSALSQEIFFCCLFAVSMVLVIYLRMKDITKSTALGYFCALVGIACVYSIAHVYMQKTIPSYNTIGTFLHFLGTGLLVGGSLGSLIYAIGASKYYSLSMKTSDLAFVSIAVLGLVLEYVAAPLNIMARAGINAYGTSALESMFAGSGSVCMMTLAALATGLGLLVLVLGWMAFRKNENTRCLLASSFFAVLLILGGSLVSRFFFYEAYLRLGI